MAAPLPRQLGKSVKGYLIASGVVYSRPGQGAEQAELQDLAADGASAPSTAAKLGEVRVHEVARRRFFQNWMGELVQLRWWGACAIFCTAQLVCFFLTEDSLFGTLTGGVVESLHLVITGRSMSWHMFGGIALWAIGASQCLVKPFRHGRLAVVHRTLGRVFLLLWLLVVGPTAAYLSLFCGTGPLRAQFWMTCFAIVSMDTTLHAYYFFWRGWRVMRKRANGEASVELHRKAMTTGLIFTMTIIWQRPLQVFFIGARRVLLLVAALFGWDWLRVVAESCLDHNVGLAITTTAIGFPTLLLDGPHSGMVRSVFNLTSEQEEELFGSREPGFKELLFWRLRHPAYLVLRALVTDFWTRDPDA